jgi:hypothetical protein
MAVDTAEPNGTTVNLALRVMMKKHALVDKKDYRIVEVAFPRALAPGSPRVP